VFLEDQTELSFSLKPVNLDLEVPAESFILDSGEKSIEFVRHL